MKKSVITLLGLLIALFAYADAVDVQQARTIAQRWLGSEVTEAACCSDAYYIFNGADGGWIIISAEDAATPVLGYNDTGSLNPDRMPANLKNWMGGYEKEIKSARADRQKPTSEVKALWKTAGYRTKSAAGKVLETPLWGQEGRQGQNETWYNDQCPEVQENGKTYKAITGCVATAMAEIIRYHQWPEHGTGTIGGYQYESDYKKNVSIPSYSIDSHSYDYSLMPMEYKGSENTAQKNAVAQLMHDCGVMVQAMYNYNSGTGAYSENIANALVEHMSYSGSAQLVYRLTYTDAEWTRMIEKEIDEGRPILYGGNDPSAGGHQFVCDGYDTRDYIRINWGWDGDGNGFFTLTLKIPGQYTFSDGQDMVIGLKPNKDNDGITRQGPLMYDIYNNSSTGLKLESGSVLDKSFKITADAISNLNCTIDVSNYMAHYTDYNGSIKAALVDWKGDLKEFISDAQNVTIASSMRITGIQCNITGDVRFGDRVVLYCTNSLGEWEMIKGRQAEDNSGKTYYLSSSIPAVDAAFILVPENPKAGDTFFVDIVPGSQPVKSFTWYYDGSKQEGVSANLTAGTHTVKAEVTFKDGAKETLAAKILVK